MSNLMFRSHPKPLKLFASTAVAALLIGWAAGVGAQTTTDSSAAPTQQASLPAAGTAETQPAIPLGPENVSEVQNQLIALGFNPGPADGQIGPATTSAAQQYDLSRGGNGHVSIDGEFLARLKADTAPRLTYDEVAARSRAAQPAQTSQAHSSAPAPATSQFGNVVSQIAPIIGAAIANSNNNNRGYGPGYYGPGPGYYGPPPGYYGYGY
ncbi:peptidoglycan-binding domain-containing protein [Reyranella sp.]|uniref:peptidoglycan-binding domain-containing protein n=1 Tax=Reyranella sp. TaxID=1929291 RepID=UPI003D11FD8D